MNDTLKAALLYRQHGYSIIPISPNDKIPLIQWTKYQSEIATEAEIRAWWDKWHNAGIGIVTGEVSGIVVIDIDSKEGEIACAPYIEGAYPQVKTPRKNGMHLYCTHQQGDVHNKARVFDGVDVRGNGGYVIAPPTKLNGKDYRFIKGRSVLNRTGLVNLDSLSIYNIISNSNISNSVCLKNSNSNVLVSLDTKESLRERDHTRPQVTTDDHKMFGKGTRDNDIFHAAMCLAKGQMEEKNMVQVLEILAKNCNPPFSKKETEIKIKSAFDRINNQDRNLAQEVRDFVVSTRGHFLTTEVNQSLHLTTRREKKTANAALGRLLEEGLIERYGERNGVFRRIEHQIEFQKLSEIDRSRFDVKLPFGAEDFVGVQPKNIIAFAGVTDAGKSIMLLECARLNMYDHRVKFFSFESSMDEIFTMIETCTKNTVEDFDHVKWCPNPPNFLDIIDPNAVNIIDYIEARPGESAYDIPATLSEIHRRLNKGIAIVALQKNKDVGWGIGGQQTKAKPRLYFNIDAVTQHESKLEIIKAKLRGPIAIKDKRKPTGMNITFNHLNALDFHQTSEWEG